MHSLLHDIPQILILFREELFLILNQMLSIWAFGACEFANMLVLTPQLKRNCDKKRFLYELQTNGPMGDDRSPGSLHNVWRYHNWWCSKAGNSELETVNMRYYASPGYLQVLKKIWIQMVKVYFTDAQGQLTL